MPCGNPSERQASVHGRVITYELHRNPRRRKRLTLSAEGALLRVLAPVRTPQRLIDEFIQDRADWISKRLVIDRPTGLQSELRSGGSLPLLGTSYPVEPGLMPFGFDGRRFIVNASRPNRAAAAEGWFREYARDHFTGRLRHWSPIVGAEPTSVQIRNQKTRWGSASSRGTLSFNWRLIFAQPQIVDYVVVHELCHLIQPDHSAAYWRLVNEAMPDAQHWRRQLKEIGESLRW